MRSNRQACHRWPPRLLAWPRGGAGRWDRRAIALRLRWRPARERRAWGWPRARRTGTTGSLRAAAVRGPGRRRRRRTGPVRATRPGTSRARRASPRAWRRRGRARSAGRSRPRTSLRACAAWGLGWAWRARSRHHRDAALGLEHAVAGDRGHHALDLGADRALGLDRHALDLHAG